MRKKFSSKKRPQRNLISFRLMIFAAVFLSFILFFLDIPIIYLFLFFILIFTLLYLLSRPFMKAGLAKLADYFKNRPYKTTLIVLLAALLAIWGVKTEAIVFLSFTLMLVIFGMDTRIAAFPALTLLTLCPVLIYFKREDIAEQLAIYAFYFLVIFVSVEIFTQIQIGKRIISWQKFFSRRRHKSFLQMPKIPRYRFAVPIVHVPDLKKYFIFLAVGFVVISGGYLLVNKKGKPMENIVAVYNEKPLIFIPVNVASINPGSDLEEYIKAMSVTELKDVDFIPKNDAVKNFPAMIKLFEDKKDYAMEQDIEGKHQAKLLATSVPQNVYYKEENDMLTIYTMTDYEIYIMENAVPLGKPGKNNIFISPISSDLFFFSLKQGDGPKESPAKIPMGRNTSGKIGEITGNSELTIWVARVEKPDNQIIVKTIPLKYTFVPFAKDITISNEDVLFLNDQNDKPDKTTSVSDNIRIYVYIDADKKPIGPKKVSFDIKSKKEVIITGASDPFILAYNIIFDERLGLSVKKDIWEISDIFRTKKSDFTNILLDNSINSWYVDTDSICKQKKMCHKNSDGTYDLVLEIE